MAIIASTTSSTTMSVRTLHFYDETGLLKPAHHGANGYRYYEEPQLLALQQILFYREVGFDLKQIKRILGKAGFEQVAALQSHRKVLEENLTRTHALIVTIDKTIQHLEGIKAMNTEELFVGFSVGAGRDRFNERIRIAGSLNDCKVSAKDTGGAMCILEFTGIGSWPLHLHHAQDEWVYVIQGEFHFRVGEERFHAGAGESVFLPRNVAHLWASVEGKPGKLINVYQPAGNIESFFREVGNYNGKAKIHEILPLDKFSQLFEDHGMNLVGPPITGEWKVDEAGRIIQTA